MSNNSCRIRPEWILFDPERDLLAMVEFLVRLSGNLYLYVFITINNASEVATARCYRNLTIIIDAFTLYILLSLTF